MVMGVLDGYNAAFSHGQTGSGKTHTMGPDGASQHESSWVNDRALTELFETAEQGETDGVAYTIAVEMRRFTTSR